MIWAQTAILFYTQSSVNQDIHFLSRAFNWCQRKLAKCSFKAYSSYIILYIQATTQSRIFESQISCPSAWTYDEYKCKGFLSLMLHAHTISGNYRSEGGLTLLAPSLMYILLIRQAYWRPREFICTGATIAVCKGLKGTGKFSNRRSIYAVYSWSA